MDNFSKGERERLSRVSESRKRKLKQIVLWVVVVGLIVGGSIWAISVAKKAEQKKPGVAYPEVGREHISPPLQGKGYNSNPPTSGEHYPNTASWGAHDEIVADEYLLHNLEHGGIWISYRDSSDKELIAQLKDTVKDYTVKVVLTPRSENDSAIAAAAWGRLLKLEVFDRQQILDFIKAYINKGPEDVPF